jgi:type IV secretory pathway VirD2 relaxase
MHSGLSAHLFLQVTTTCGAAKQVVAACDENGPLMRLIGAPAMGSKDNDDLFEGDVSRRWPQSSTERAPLFRPPSAASSKRVAARKRAAWFNRSRGAPNVRLAHVRPAGQQRVIIKLKPVVHAAARGGGGGGALMRHALYVERDGAGRDGDPVQVFDRDLDRADGAAFVERCEDDRHHFRVIISPEHGASIDDLKSYTRDLMGRVELDLDTRIDWIAAEHHDTGKPHVHLLMRGRHPDGRDLVIPRAYVSHGFRERAEGLATEILGPRLEPDRLDRAVKLERFTELDRDLLARARGGEIAMSSLPEDGERAGRLVQRLNRLEEWGLAEQSRPGAWRLHAELEDKLIRLAEARDRERATARLLAQENRGVEPGRTRELEAAHSSQRVTGRLVGLERLGDDVRGPHLIGVEAIDGKFWTARVGRLEDLRGLAGVERGAIVELERATPEMKASDRTIWEIAKENDLDYSADLHRHMRPSDRDNYIKMHERRLEALRRDGIVTRDRDGTFHLPDNYLSRVAAREGLGERESARVSLLDPHSLEHQRSYPGPTWLDRMADGAEDRSQLRYEGFGEEAREAWKQRETALEKLGLGENRADGFHPADDWRGSLAAMEEKAVRDRIERDTGRVAHIAREGDQVHGLYTSRIHMAEQSYALIERADHRFSSTLVPWRPEMDRALNQFVSGRINGRDFDFKFGKGVEKEIAKALSIGGRG